MATKYFRITGYLPKDDICFIMDSNGLFEKMWQFSAFCIEKGVKVIEISNDEKFIDVNIEKAQENPNKVILRAYSTGQPQYITTEKDGVEYKAIQIKDKIYIP